MEKEIMDGIENIIVSQEERFETTPPDTPLLAREFSYCHTYAIDCSCRLAVLDFHSIRHSLANVVSMSCAKQQ